MMEAATVCAGAQLLRLGLDDRVVARASCVSCHHVAVPIVRVLGTVPRVLAMPLVSSARIWRAMFMYRPVCIVRRLVDRVARALVANHVTHAKGALPRAARPVDLGK